MRLVRLTLVVMLISVMTGGSASFAQGRSPVPPTSPISAELVIPDANNLLPGVPFEMWIEVRNPSDATVSLGLCADMLVRKEGGESFEITLGGEEGPPYPTLLPVDRWNGRRLSELVMRPHQTQTLTLPILSELEGPIYFKDERLAPPGRYQISLRLDYCWGDRVPRKASLPPEFLGPVTTNEVTVERATQSGSDAEVWKRMQELTRGKWIPYSWTSTEAGVTVVKEIREKYSDSNFYPYALLAASFGAVDEKAYNRFVAAIERFPNSPVRESLEVCAFGTSLAPGKGFAAHDAYFARIKASKRPTTRILFFGREDLPKDSDDNSDD